MRGTKGRLQETAGQRKLWPEIRGRFRARCRMPRRRVYFFFDEEDFLLLLFLDEDEDFFALLFFADDFFGTLAPSLRASDNPIAMACFRLVTFLPLRPLFSVPLFFSRIVRATFFCAFGPYFLPDDFFEDFVAIQLFSLLQQ